MLNKIEPNKIDFLKELEDHSVVFTCDYAEIDVPADYFDKGIAEMIGKDVELFGFFEIKVYAAEEDDEENKKLLKKVFFKHKGVVSSSPSSIQEKKDSKGEKIMTLCFKKGDPFIRNTNIVINSKVATKMLDLMTLGKLPNVIPYEEIASYWSSVNEFNGVKIGSMSQASIELIVSEVARDPKNLSRTYRARLRDDPKTNRYSWKLINIRLIPRYSSTFAAITAGDPKSGLITSANRNRSGGTDRYSPVEDAIM